MLRTFVLTGDHDIGRQMGQAHRRIGFIDMLAAGAAGAVGIDAQIVVINFDFNIVVDLGINEDRSERCMAARVGIEGRDSHQAVNSGFGFEISVSIVAGNAERNAFDPRFLARLIIEYLFAITAPIAPAQIHAQENLGPVLRLGAAGAGMKRN